MRVGSIIALTLGVVVVLMSAPAAQAHCVGCVYQPIFDCWTCYEGGGNWHNCVVGNECTTNHWDFCGNVGSCGGDGATLSPMPEIVFHAEVISQVESVYPWTANILSWFNQNGGVKHEFVEVNGSDRSTDATGDVIQYELSVSFDDHRAVSMRLIPTKPYSDESLQRGLVFQIDPQEEVEGKLVVTSWSEL